MGFSPFIIWGLVPQCAIVQELVPLGRWRHPPLKAAQRGNSLTVRDLHLVGRGSPLHPVAAVHGEGVRFAEKPAAKKGRQAVRTHRHPPGPARERGCVRGCSVTSQRVTAHEAEPRSCGDSTRGQPGTRSESRQPCVGRGM